MDRAWEHEQSIRFWHHPDQILDPGIFWFFYIVRYSKTQQAGFFQSIVQTMVDINRLDLMLCILVSTVERAKKWELLSLGIRSVVPPGRRGQRWEWLCPFGPGWEASHCRWTLCTPSGYSSCAVPTLYGSAEKLYRIFDFYGYVKVCASKAGTSETTVSAFVWVTE